MALRSRNTVIAVMKNKEGKILIGFSERVNSGDSKVVDTKTWKMPQGGMDDKETVAKTLIRELKEELNFDPTGCQVDMLSETIPYYFFDENGIPDFEVKLHPILIHYEGEGVFNFDKNEFSGLEWMDPKDILNLDLGIRRNAYIVILKKFDLL